MQTCTILTNDPSFTAWGWAVLNIEGTPLASGCIKTEPEHKKKRTRAADDRTRRAAEISCKLLEIIRKWDVRLILSELPHGSQNAQAAIMIGIVAGITTAISESLGIPIEYYSEQDAKKAVLGKRAAMKSDMVLHMMKEYPSKWYKHIKYHDEAVADALAIHYVASQQSTVLKMLKYERNRKG